MKPASQFRKILETGRLGARLRRDYGAAAALRALRDVERASGDIGWPSASGVVYFARAAAGGQDFERVSRSLAMLADQVCPDDAVVVDVGANSGVFACYAKRRAPSARLIAVEPDVSLHATIARNLERFDRWEIANWALSSSTGSATLYRNPQKTQTNSLHSSVAQLFGQTEEVTVQTTTLDELCTELNVPRIDLLKLDVQGSETAVLKGGATMLSRTRSVLVEVTFMDGPPNELLSILEAEFGEPKTLGPVYMGADLLYQRHD